MSDQNKISPLLDGFTLGAPISDHHGVACYPAIKENTNKKYIVKKISVPATQAQFDAMLLAGAYKDPGDAMEYFRGNGEGIQKEAELLKTLSKIEGFLPYDGWQMEPITRRRLGYEVYLVGSYKRSLEKYMRKNPFTHLEAVNLALDLCSALSVCRQAGFLYVDLKPSNIYVSEKKEYRIGDLGFIRLDTLRYASLPERCFSPYTPPELMDPMVSMNLTVDTYAVGMILYQLYNDGNLPFKGMTPSDELPNPCHADYEMAEIIMKAIHPQPEERWSDPKELGKAIASYMQKNGVNDIPITPFTPLEVNPEDFVVISSETQSRENADEDSVSEESSVKPESAEESQDDLENKSTSDPEEPETVVSSAPEEDAALPHSDKIVLEDDVSKSEDTIESDEVVVPSSGELTSQVLPDETEEDFAETISEEVAKIICRADDIIAHEIPEETAFPVEETVEDPFAFAAEDFDDREDKLPSDPLMNEDPAISSTEKKKTGKSFQNTSRKAKFKKFISRIFTLLIFCCIGVAGFWYYQNVFLQTVDSMTISGTQDEITVLIDTNVEEAQLTVKCTDSSGKQKRESVIGGKVTFSDLKASTEYTIQMEISGFHKLVGETTAVFTTDATTQVSSFQAIAGTEDGSVMLDFTVDGNDPDFWNIRYAAEGEEERTETVTGHSALITGLSVGKLYTFTLDGGKNFDLGGETSIQFLASKLILAEKMTVTSTDGSDITVSWKIPGDVVVESWNVRLYDGYGFEEQVTVSEPSVSFESIDPASHYTVEVTAAGMTQPSKIDISIDPILLAGFQIDEKPQTEMNITWEYNGNTPEGGWQLIYTVDGSGTQMIPCEKNSSKVSPLIPGASYEFVLETADDRTVFNNVMHYQAADAEPYTANAFKLENMSMDLLKTPEEKDWHFETISEEAFTQTFQIGDSASLVLRSSSALYYPGAKAKVLFVFRDAYGNVLPELVEEVSYVWKNIWSAGDIKNGELDIPLLPSVPGEYKLELYFDGCFVAPFDITMTE